MIPELVLPMDAAQARIVDFLQCEFAAAGRDRAVLGLSGGVDSALVAALCARALGPARILALLLPHRRSSPDSRADAETVAAQLGLRTELIDITPMVDPFLDANPDMDPVRRGNVMARMRMIVLYDRSAREDALVVGTGNKTELLLGYSTLHGDAACALLPLGNLYKSQVWDLARHMDLPARIIAKPPSADLWAGQTDEEELGLSYRMADELLFRLVDERRDPASLPALGYDAVLVDRVLRLMRSSRFKRMATPLAPAGAGTALREVRYASEWGM
jgi:NAD+ synthase